MTRTYTSPLRQRQANETRERIVDVTHALLRDRRPADLTYAEIAERAEVALRTVYRHFPTTDALLLAVSDRLLARLVDGVDFSSLEGAVEAMRRQWRMFDEDPALFRVWFSVPTRSRGGGNAILEALFSPRLAAVPVEARPRVLALIDLLTSPYAWDVLHKNWGLPADVGLDVVLAAVDAVVETAVRQPATFRPPEQK